MKGQYLQQELHPHSVPDSFEGTGSIAIRFAIAFGVISFDGTDAHL